MRILIIESSPHKRGSSNMLADRFIDGAKEAGHKVEIFDAARADIHPCLGCDACGMAGSCSQKDDMMILRDNLLESDMAVFVTPLYYFGMSAQLKMVVDRFYSFTGTLASRKLKTALIAASWDNKDWTMKELAAHYQTLCKYMNFQDQGMILGTGCGSVYMTEHSPFLEKAYTFGRSLKG